MLRHKKLGERTKPGHGERSVQAASEKPVSRNVASRNVRESVRQEVVV